MQSLNMYQPMLEPSPEFLELIKEWQTKPNKLRVLKTKKPSLLRRWKTARRYKNMAMLHKLLWNCELMQAHYHEIHDLLYHCGLRRILRDATVASILNEDEHWWGENLHKIAFYYCVKEIRGRTEEVTCWEFNQTGGKEFPQYPQIRFYDKGYTLSYREWGEETFKRFAYFNEAVKDFKECFKTIEGSWEPYPSEEGTLSNGRL